MMFSSTPSTRRWHPPPPVCTHPPTFVTRSAAGLHAVTFLSAGGGGGVGRLALAVSARAGKG